MSLNALRRWITFFAALLVGIAISEVEAQPRLVRGDLRITGIEP